MRERVARYIREQQLLSSGDRLIVAVSGGPDSVCLLHILHALSREWGWSLVVAHLDHGFRGTAASCDAQFVESLAESLGWPSVIGKVDIPALLRAAGGSPQEVSRQQRYKFLRDVCNEQKAQAVLLAHHLADQAETVLLNLARGAGLTGLGGMRPAEEIDDLRLVRPLLAERKLEVMRYLAKEGLSFRIDESNVKGDYTRNYLRQEVLPRLMSINSEVEEALARTAELCSPEDAYLSARAQEAFSRLADIHEKRISLDIVLLRELPLALQRRVIRLVYCKLAGHSYDLSFNHVEQARSLLAGPAGRSVSWPGELECRLTYDKLEIGWDSANRAAYSYPLSVPGYLLVPETGHELRASILAPTEVANLAADPQIAYLDGDAVGEGTLQVRNWRAGDSFMPLGMGRFKKLQDFFIDNKVSRGKRQRIPIVLRGDDIAWIAGLRIDERFRVTPCTKRIVCLECRSLNND